MHKPSNQMAADSHVAYNNNNDDDNNNRNERYVVPPNHQRDGAMISFWEKQRKSGVADAQIWRWKSHNERALLPRYTKETELGYNVSVCATILRHDAMNLTKFRRNVELRTVQHKGHSVHVRKEPFVTLEPETGSLLTL
jgi:hypothetical protein